MQLVELLQEIRDHYNEVLMQRWVHVFRDIFDEDNYHPIQVTYWTAVSLNRFNSGFLFYLIIFKFLKFCFFN